MTGKLFEASGTLAGRYRQTVRQLAGFSPSLEKIERFSLDRTGFSPEVAEILGQDYLRHDSIKRWMIFISPEQEHAPVLKSLFSFEGDIASFIFTEARNMLARITVKEPVIADVDPGIVRISKPEDLVGVRKISVRLDTPSSRISELLEARRLSEKLGEGMNLLDENYIARLSELVSRVGKPEAFPDIVQELEFDISSYYCQMFGESYIFSRSSRKSVTVMVFCGECDSPYSYGRNARIMPLDDPDGFEKLLEWGYITLPSSEKEMRDKLEKEMVRLKKDMEGGRGKKMDAIGISAEVFEALADASTKLYSGQFELEEILRELPYGARVRLAAAAPEQPVAEKYLEAIDWTGKRK